MGGGSKESPNSPMLLHDEVFSLYGRTVAKRQYGIEHAMLAEYAGTWLDAVSLELFNQVWNVTARRGEAGRDRTAGFAVPPEHKSLANKRLCALSEA